MSYYLVEESVLKEHGIVPNELSRSLDWVTLEDLLLHWHGGDHEDELLELWEEMPSEKREFIMEYIHESIEENAPDWAVMLAEANYAYQMRGGE